MIYYILLIIIFMTGRVKMGTFPVLVIFPLIILVDSSYNYLSKSLLNVPNGCFLVKLLVVVCRESILFVVVIKLFILR